MVYRGAVVPSELSWPSQLTVPSTVDTGQPLAIGRTYEVSDVAAGEFTIGYYLSTDDVFDGGDVLIGTETIASSSDRTVGVHGGTYDVTVLTGGTYYVFGVLDDGDAVIETDETNNVAISSSAVEVIQAPLPPTIGWLTVLPDPAAMGSDVTLTAENVADANGTVTSVAFYRDANGTGTLEVGTDDLVGTDTDDSDGWSVTISTWGLSAGTYRYFAQATDNDLLTSNVVSGTGELVAPSWVVDDGGAGHSRSGSGWLDYGSAGYQGDLDYVKYPNGSNTSSWVVSLAAGEYEVYATWAANTNRASNAGYTILDGGVAEQTVYVNQRVSPAGVWYDGTNWYSLGTYEITGGQLRVDLSDAGVNCQIIADAIYVVYRGAVLP